MKAMILAAGVGSRLDPLTRALPKPMVPIVNRPVMEHLINLLKQHNFTEIMVNLHYLGDQIKAYFGDGSRWGVRIHYSEEEQLWGDAGSVKRCEEFFDDTFIVIGGDDLTDLDLTRLIKFHKEKKSLCTIALSLVEDPSEYGIALLNERGRITRFLEKPKGEMIFSNAANIGIYVLEPDALELIPRGAEDDLSTLYRESPLPIFVDESCFDSRDVARLADRVHGVNIKLMKCGGLSEALRMVHTARALGLQVMYGCYSDSSLAISAASQIAPLADHLDLDSHLNLLDDPFVGAELQEGRVVPTAAPGLGVRLREMFV